MNIQLYNDKAYNFPLKAVNAAGETQPWPAGAPGVVSSKPASLGVQVGGFPNFVVTLVPKVQASSGIIVTLTSQNMVPATFSVDIVPDPNVLSIVVDGDVTHATTTAQDIPTAPGP